jgi:predicted metal-dependent peptidase
MPRIFLPRNGERVVGRAVFGVDTSGSISQEELTEYFSECQYIRDLYEIQDTTVCGCDTRLHDVITLDGFENMVDVKFKGGGGGTDMDPLVKYANKHEVDFMVIFTDGYFGNLTVQPEVPILWVITSDKAHFQSDIGEIIYYDNH